MGLITVTTFAYTGIFIIAAIISSSLLALIAAVLLLVTLICMEHIMGIIDGLKTLWGKSETEEKVDKLAKALGLRWQVYPERRRWVTKNTPPPELEVEQPELVQHSVRDYTNE